MRLLGGKKQRIICRVASSLFFQQRTKKIQVKRRIHGGWIQAEDLYVIIIFFENIVKRTLENP